MSRSHDRRASRSAAAAPSLVESLEGRTLLSVAPHASSSAPARVVDAYLDTRGLAWFTFTKGLDASTLSYKTASMYTAGTDGQFGTGDDVRLQAAVSYRKGKLTIAAKLKKNTAYRIRLSGGAIKDVNGRFLDGEFNGDLKQSGNGVQGGNYDVTTGWYARARVQFTTNLGVATVGLYKGVTTTTNAFLTYANAGSWDGSFFHRSEHRDPVTQQNLDVIQGGGYKVANGQLTTVPDLIPDFGTQGLYDNAKGTIAMARTNDPNSNNHEWFFNTKANTDLDGNYTVFGGVVDAASQATIDLINSQRIRNAQDIGLPFNELPVLTAAGATAGQPVAISDLVTINRIAVLFAPSATPNVSAKAVAAPAAAGVAVAPVVAPRVTFATSAIQRDDVFADGE